MSICAGVRPSPRGLSRTKPHAQDGRKGRWRHAETARSIASVPYRETLAPAQTASPPASARTQPIMPVAVVPSRFEPEQVETAAQREQRTVHDVYEQIAPHFSATRYKVRPPAGPMPLPSAHRAFAR